MGCWRLAQFAHPPGAGSRPGGSGVGKTNERGGSGADVRQGGSRAAIGQSHHDRPGRSRLRQGQLRHARRGSAGRGAFFPATYHCARTGRGRSPRCAPRGRGAPFPNLRVPLAGLLPRQDFRGDEGGKCLLRGLYTPRPLCHISQSPAESLGRLRATSGNCRRGNDYRVFATIIPTAHRNSERWPSIWQLISRRLGSGSPTS